VGLTCGYETKQIASRLNHLLLQQILRQFNQGQIDAADASHHLQISRAHLYRLRTASSRNAPGSPSSSRVAITGRIWPPEAVRFLKQFLPLQRPPNFQPVADELETRPGFKRHHQSVAAFARTHFSTLISQPQPRPKARRRWERSGIDELWQHDSSIHQSFC
jgi:hypothetical protein